MRRRPSARIFTLLLILFAAIFVAAGYLSGHLGFSRVQAILAMAVLGLVAVPALIIVAPHILQRRGK